MGWQKTDDQYGISRKISRLSRRDIQAPLRLAAVGLDQLAMNYSVRSHTDGIIDEDELDELLAQTALVDALVKVDRWHRRGHDCPRCVQPPENGIVIHDFLIYNPDAASVAARTADKSSGGREGNHRRWHAQRGVSVPGCEWCATDDRSDNRSGIDKGGNRSANPPGPGPGPKDLTDINHPPKSGPVSNARDDEPDKKMMNRLRRQALTDAQQLGITDLAAVRDWLEKASGMTLNMGQAVELSRDILGRSRGDVLEPDRYVIGVCRKSPHRVAEYADGRDFDVEG